MRAHERKEAMLSSRFIVDGKRREQPEVSRSPSDSKQNITTPSEEIPSQHVTRLADMDERWRRWKERDDARRSSFISRLQEMRVKQHKPLPAYSEVGSQGPPNERLFQTSVKVDSIVVVGTGNDKESC